MLDKLRIVEWNLHGMTGVKSGGEEYSFPVRLIISSIENIGFPEIIVFTEFISDYYKDEDSTNDNALEFKKKLENMGYTINMSKPKERRNGICIAVNKEKIGEKAGKIAEEIEITKVEGESELSAIDYLAIKIEEIVLFGVRFTGKVDNSQIHNLIYKKMSIYEKVIAIGDFNKSKADLKFNRVIKDGSRKIYVHGGSNNKPINDIYCSTLDHVLTTYDADVTCEYNWDFMINLYKSVNKKASYVSQRCVPDHAMLIAEVSI